MPPLHPDSDAEVRRRLAESVPEADRDEAWAAYEDARVSGLCHEGAWEAALGAAESARPDAPLVPRTSPT